jgi:excisionase family DNA binding protein
MDKSKVVSTPSPSLGDLLTTEQVAQRFGVGTVTVKRSVRRGELQCIRLSPSCVRFEESEVSRYLASKRS